MSKVFVMEQGCMILYMFQCSHMTSLVSSVVLVRDECEGLSMVWVVYVKYRVYGVVVVVSDAGCGSGVVVEHGDRWLMVWN